jgi:hypothetical protein
VPADLREALDAAAPRRVPDLDVGRLLGRHRRARALHAAGAVAALVIAVAGIGWALAPGLVELWVDDLLDRSDDEAALTDDFVGTWEAEDLDGSQLRMTIRARDKGTYEVEAADDSSAACWGAPAAMSGIGTPDSTTRLTIAQVYRCEDGTVVTEARGIRLDEWHLDLAGGELTDPTGVVWSRAGTQPPVVDGPQQPESVTLDTPLGSWTWTWIPEAEGAARRWQDASERWEDADRFPASIPDMSWVTDEWWEDNWEWLNWHRIPWAHVGTTTVATFLGGSPTNPADTRKDWHLVVDLGDGYEPHEVPWHGLPVMDVDLATRSDHLVAVALVGDLATNDWNPSNEQPQLHSWRSADGTQWEELSRPRAVGDARRLRLVGDNDRLLLRLEGPAPSLWTSPDGIDWQQVGPERITAWHFWTPTPTSFGWAVAASFHADAFGDVWRCEVWVSADTQSWEQVPFHQAVEDRALGDALNCRVFDDEVYVLLTKGQGTYPADGLWIGQIDD